MPKMGKEDAAQHYSAEGFDGNYGELDDYTVGFEAYSADVNMADLFKGLPDDRCQCPHWGYVIKGEVVYHYADGDDEITEGQAYYARPGHTPKIFAGSEVVEFSPTAELAKTIEVVTKNMGGEA